MILRWASDLHNGILYTDKTTSLYCNSPLVANYSISATNVWDIYPCLALLLYIELRSCTKYHPSYKCSSAKQHDMIYINESSSVVDNFIYYDKFFMYSFFSFSFHFIIPAVDNFIRIDFSVIDIAIVKIVLYISITVFHDVFPGDLYQSW